MPIGLVAGGGFEPPFADSKSAVLPLDEPALSPRRKIGDQGWERTVLRTVSRERASENNSERLQPHRTHPRVRDLQSLAFPTWLPGRIPLLKKTQKLVPPAGIRIRISWITTRRPGQLDDRGDGKMACAPIGNALAGRHKNAFLQRETRELPRYFSDQTQKTRLAAGLPMQKTNASNRPT